MSVGQDFGASQALVSGTGELSAEQMGYRLNKDALKVGSLTGLGGTVHKASLKGRFIIRPLGSRVNAAISQVTLAGVGVEKLTREESAKISSR